MSVIRTLPRAKQPGRKWFAKFHTGHMSTEDDARSGRPKEAVTDENVKKIHKIILGDRKIRLIDKAEALKISKERVGHIIHEYLDMRKLCAKWVPRNLTFDQKQQRIDDSEACLEVILRNKTDFFRRYVTMDETWLHHYTPELNRQSAKWTAASEPPPKRGKTQRSAGKVMASVFWDARGIIFYRLSPKGPDHQQRLLYSVTGAFEGRNRQETTTNEEEKNLVSPGQCAVPQVHENDVEIA